MVINMFGRVCIDLKKQRTPKLNYCGNRLSANDQEKREGHLVCAV